MEIHRLLFLFSLLRVLRRFEVVIVAVLKRILKKKTLEFPVTWEAIPLADVTDMPTQQQISSLIFMALNNTNKK